MPQTIYGQHNYNCQLDSIDVYFEYSNSVVFCTGESTLAHNGFEQISCKELAVISSCEIEQYEGPAEVDRFFRGDNLVIQGIISFFTGIPLTVYHSNKGSSGLTPIKYKKQKPHLIIEEIDYTDDLFKLLKKLEEEPDLIITLLDRWRKAIYLKAESTDADLYYDEATLSFFHILELFGEQVNLELKTKLETNIEKMLKQHFSYYYFSDKQIEQMVNQNKKAVGSLLIGDFLSLSIKVKYFLEKYNMLDDSVSYFIDNMIKIRNSIAHGRITYQKLFIWPLPPFFNLAKDSYENIEFLFFLTAAMISRYIGMGCWLVEWNEAKEFLMPPEESMKSFLTGDIQFDSNQYDMLTQGNEYNITWRTLFNYYVKKPKKVVRNQMEEVTKDIFMNTTLDEDNAADIFNISLIYADSEKSDIRDKAINNIKDIIQNDWMPWSNVKDARTYLEFYSVDIQWYKSFLNNKEYLDCR